MSLAPATITAFGRFWTAQGGVNLGIVGNTAHTQGYHLGQDRIFDGSGPGVGWNDYSVKTTRDKNGLNNYANAIDLGRLDGSLTRLWEFSQWFAQRCIDGHPAFRDVREIIYWNPERGRVVGWSDTAPHPPNLINDYGDLSHKTHTHISFYRDSFGRDKTAMLKLYPPFMPPPPPPVVVPTGDPMLTAYLPGYTAILKPTSNVRATPALNGSLIRTVGATPEVWTIVGRTKGDVDPDGGSDQWYVRWASTRYEYTAFSNVPVAPVAPVSAATLAAETAKVTAAMTSLATVKTELVACTTKVAQAVDVLT